MKYILGWCVILFSLTALAAVENPQKLKLQFEMTMQQPGKVQQIHSNAILTPGADWQTMSSDRSLIIQGKLQSIDAEVGQFEFQILDAETKKIISQSSLLGAYGKEASIRNESKDSNGQPLNSFEMKIKPTIQ